MYSYNRTMECPRSCLSAPGPLSLASRPTLYCPTTLVSIVACEGTAETAFLRIPVAPRSPPFNTRTPSKTSFQVVLFIVHQRADPTPLNSDPRATSWRLVDPHSRDVTVEAQTEGTSAFLLQSPCTYSLLRPVRPFLWDKVMRIGHCSSPPSCVSSSRPVSSYDNAPTKVRSDLGDPV